MSDKEEPKDVGGAASQPEAKSNSHLLKTPVRHYDAFMVAGVADTLASFRGTAFQSRNLSRCLEVLLNILQDKDRPIVFMGLAGAMVPGGLRKTIRDMIDMGIVDVLVSTGANLYHDLHEALGFRHYLAHRSVSDVELRRRSVDRIFDVYANDMEFQQSDVYIKKFADSLEPRRYSTREFLNLLGKTLRDESSVLATATSRGVPVFCPAISDSSIGIALAWHTWERMESGLEPVFIDTILDNLEILKVKREAKKTAAIFIGGGVPKNYIQQIAPMASVMNMSVTPHSYGIQITTDDPKWGGLSGCTFDESKSWGKYTEHARFATVYMDATIGLPLLFQACVERKDSWYPRPPLDISLPHQEGG